jgi:hypothetical protein
MDPRLNHLYALSETERRIAEARRHAPRARRRLLPRWPSGRTVDPAMFGRRWGITR